ncbi:MAG TPA: hypothetical protein PKA88_12730 [Polyangiaceae bacterium]|nr:hypothetical protein [Polyangiaceae bacterium]HMR76168.1 hypothetical protein [Polyangiaceae bacterium]
MSTMRFDPSHAVKFNLAAGHIDLEGARVLVPPDALLELCTAAGAESVTDFGRRMGTEVGRRVAARLGDGIKGASIEGVVDHFGGDLALLGLGNLGIERWGRALIFTVEGSPLGAAGDALVAAVLEGAMQRGAGRDVRIVFLTREDTVARFAALSASTAGKASGWLSEGVAWGDVIVRLQAGNV